MLIGGLQKTSLLDFPEKISAIVFTAGCNFRCGYCHNPELIKQVALVKDDIFAFLQTRIGKLDGVVITGGEPCLQKDLPEFIKQIKSMGFAVKLDTNGSFPEMLETVLPDLDYVAMDIKAPLEKYSEIVNVPVNTDNILKSIRMLQNSGIDHEFRTTVLESQLTFEDFESIGHLLNGSKKYILQKFVPSKILDEELLNHKTYSNEQFQKIINMLSLYINKLELR